MPSTGHDLGQLYHALGWVGDMLGLGLDGRMNIIGQHADAGAGPARTAFF